MTGKHEGKHMTDTDTKFTSGPWLVGQECDWSIDTGGENTFGFVGPNGGTPVAVIVVPSAFGLDDIFDANMALIAAAPELYEALGPVYSCLKSVDFDAPEWSGECRITITITLDEARAIKAARAKARGEA